ncbi:DUF3099 domain-containing protein [Corynebacterium freneyi]|uniref:DUF3099 domain-containing protein n=1 Tax=Corynebacterium freneyi TaxID=134034 RepID=UPI00254E517A|nr:DUF3099 domain-containing protein [Corynebacterium freneyi]MDK8767056.1 DUF3099 domain-containing protein [Corynebacterium freneyi]
MANRRTNRRGRRSPEAVLITDARQSRIRNYNYRRHTYAVLQWSRIPLLLLAAAAFLWWDLAWLAAILTVLSVPMPWIAVVIANGVGEPADKRSPRVYKPGVVREQNRRWEEAQRERLARLSDGHSHALTAGGSGAATDSDADPRDVNLPAVRGDEVDVGPYGGFDPSMIIDMEDDDAADDPADTTQNQTTDSRENRKK